LSCPGWRVPDALLARLRAALARLIAENPGTRPEHLVLRWGGGPRALPTHAEFLDFARTPALLDLVAGVLGSDIILWGAHVFCKPAGDGLEIPWHQDGQYWPIRPLATCTVWVALDDSTPENGCMRFIPGSHRTRTLYHHRLAERPDLALTIRQNMALRPIYLVRGVDRHGRNDFAVGQDAPYEVGAAG
jgi:Phytanoyl-CoA dioxygenase (PhyH)